jgi:hypothetical protein
MIYTCSFCGWRINQRYGRPNIKPEDIGKYILYDHKAFCSTSCVEQFSFLKTKPKYNIKQSDWHEDEWKKERKLNRPKRLKILN